MIPSQKHMTLIDMTSFFFLILFFFFLLHCMACGMQGSKLRLNHWTAREVPFLTLAKYLCLYSVSPKEPPSSYKGRRMSRI